MLPLAIQDAVDSFARLPGIGAKTAQRLAFYFLRRDARFAQEFGEAILNIKKNIGLCPTCFHISDGDTILCSICADASRDMTMVCVVEEPLDIVALEKPGYFKGIYHVLHGALSPVDGMGPDELKIRELYQRLEKGGVAEVILATNPTTEGEATALYIQKLIAPLEITTTRIARGIPFGGDIEYADEVTLSRALEGRMKY
ncbi:MAG: recombination mediator RecR [Patescibacteria group bacterium]